MNTTTSNTEGKRPIVSAEKLRAAMHERDLSAREVAEAIGKSPAAFSRGIKSQSWLRDNLPALAKAVRVAKSDLEEAGGGNQMATRGPAILDRLCGEARLGGYHLPPGTEVRNVTHTTIRSWFLCAPRNRVPKQNELVVVSEEGEPDRLHRFTSDRKDSTTVVLLPVDPDEGGVRVVQRADLLDIRIAIAPLMLTGGGK